MKDDDRSSSRRYNNKYRRDDQRDRHDDRDDRRDDQPPEAYRDEHDLLPPPKTSNPNGPFQPANRLINMIVGGSQVSCEQMTLLQG
jgi:hypothetical protein